jgi:mannobiose 2-epimerase
MVLFPFGPRGGMLGLMSFLCAAGCATGPHTPAPPTPPGGGGPGAGASAIDPALAARLQAIRARLVALGNETFEFWRVHGADREHGGFHGTLDRQGRKIAPTDKGLIQTARHLWAMSMWYERKQPTAEVRALADGLYAFLTRAFEDPATGELGFTVSEAGAMIEPRLILAGEAQAIYALATYAHAFSDAGAGDRALRLFRAVDARAHDARHGGYRQINDAPWLPPGTEKETNTQVHLMEGLTALYLYRPDPTVRARLEELAAICADKLLQPSGYVHRDFRLDWSLVGAPAWSYGHDMETGWLLLEAARALGRPDDQNLVAAARTMILTSASAGYDPAQGGYFEEGVPGGAPTKREKAWWVQAEALLALWRGYELTGEVTLIDRLDRTLAFIEQHLRDAQYGEWYGGVLPDGSLGAGADRKGHAWKASYHTLRTLVFTEAWIAQALGAR